MARIAAWIKAFALSIGAPGLFVIAFLDSSFLSFPELQDLLVIGTVVRHKELMLLYASMATLGSVAGCLALFAWLPIWALLTGAGVLALVTGGRALVRGSRGEPRRPRETSDQ